MPRKRRKRLWRKEEGKEENDYKEEDDKKEKKEKNGDLALPPECWGEERGRTRKKRRERQETNKLSESKPATSATQRPFVFYPLLANCSPRQGCER